MHHIYRTEAIVINSFEISEADKDLILLTRDFGLIKVKAQGIRKNSSKLRFALQDFSNSEIALVRGKNYYRLTNAKLKNNFYYENENSELSKMIARVFSLIYRLIHGEESGGEVYDTLFNFLNLSKKISQDQIKKLETITVANVLYNLGYFEKNYSLTLETISNLDDKELQEITKEINSSLKATQL